MPMFINRSLYTIGLADIHFFIISDPKLNFLFSDLGSV